MFLSARCTVTLAPRRPGCLALQQSIAHDCTSTHTVDAHGRGSDDFVCLHICECLRVCVCVWMICLARKKNRKWMDSHLQLTGTIRYPRTVPGAVLRQLSPV